MEDDGFGGFLDMREVPEGRLRRAVGNIWEGHLLGFGVEVSKDSGRWTATIYDWPPKCEQIIRILAPSLRDAGRRARRWRGRRR